jgi:UDP-3-O-[3-hydroxymyristoyl] N-acetylglucosamine deacetylase/3-hydroxyacyl-[acyl-carrier-protein] dehydratase
MGKSEKQKTIAREVTFSGTGLHTGNETVITFKPAPVNSGISFIRADLTEKPKIHVDCANVLDTTRGTTIGLSPSVKIHTVEHILGAIAGMGIDNITAEVNANEAPVADGSALPFVKVLKEAGMVEQEQPKRYIELPEPISMSENGVQLVALPADKFEVSFKIEYPHPLINVQSAHYVEEGASFTEQIAPARTFCFLKEVEMLQEHGLIKGGSLENAIVIADDTILNDELRFDNEFVRHKILDLIGDFSLLGAPLKAHLIAVRSGHSTHIKFVQKIKNDLAARGIFIGIPETPKVPMEINEIKKIIPHRYPFLLVDRLVQLEVDKYAQGVKNVTVNEPFFQGHFPGVPLMPGVLIIEALAQVGATLLLSKPNNRGKIPLFTGIDKVRFRQQVVPGDVLNLQVDVVRLRRNAGRMHATATVNGKVVCEADLMFAVIENE